MKKIDSWTVEAVKKSFTENSNGAYMRDNTLINASESTAEILLFGNRIAVINGNRDNILFTLAGWNTQTTRARLNAILQTWGGGARISSIKKVPCFIAFNSRPRLLDKNKDYQLLFDGVCFTLREYVTKEVIIKY